MKRYHRHSKWFYVRWGMLLCVVGAVIVGVLAWSELDSVVYRKVLASFEERFIAADISISDARLVDGEGILLANFVLSTKPEAEHGKAGSAGDDGGYAENAGHVGGGHSGHVDADANAAQPGGMPAKYGVRFPPVLEAERVVIACPTKVQELMVEELPISEIIFDSATIRTYRRPDGTWSLTALKTAQNLKPSGQPAPNIRFRNTTIELLDMTDPSMQRGLTLRNVEMTIFPPVTPEEDAAGRELSPEEAKQQKYLPFEGTAQSVFCNKAAVFSGKFYPEAGMIRVDVEIDSLHYSERFRGAIPVEIAEKMEPLKDIRGDMTGKVTVVAPLTNFSQARFLVEGNLQDGRAENEKLAQAVTNIRADFRVANDGYVLSDVSGNYGESQITSYVMQRGFHPGAKKQVQVKIQRLDLTEGVSSSLPAGLQKVIRDLHPTGRVDVDAGFLFDGRKWVTTGEILCPEMSLSYAGFPYRVERLSGKVELKGEQITFQGRTPDGGISISGEVNMVGGGILPHAASAGGNPAGGGAETPAGGQAAEAGRGVSQDASHITGVVRVRAEAIPLEERLLAACPQKVAEEVRTLELAGAVNVLSEHHFSVPVRLEESQWQAASGHHGDVYFPEKEGFYKQVGEVKTDHRIMLQLLNCSCRYKNFPYPLRNVRGTINIHNNDFTAENLMGDNNDATVVLSCKARRNSGVIPAEDSPRAGGLTGMDDCVLQITGMNVTLDDEFYKNLPPTVERLFKYIRPSGTVNLRYAYQMNAGKKHERVEVDTPGGGITVTLPQLPYRLDEFKGKFVYDDGNVSLTDIKARHGTSRIAGRMHGQVVSENRWECHFREMNVDGIRFDRDFLTAIPSGIRGSITSVRPDGMLYYQGLMDVVYDSAAKRPFTLSWKGEAGVTQGSFGGASIQLTNLAGGVNVEGKWDGTDFFTFGELNLDSAFYQNVQLTQVQGPFWVDSRQMLLGGDAAKLIYAYNNRFSATQANAVQDTPPAGADQVPRQAVRARAVGGEVYGNLTMIFGEPSTFQFNAMLSKGRLEECAYLTGNAKLRGNILATVDLTGNTNSLRFLKGSGEIHLSDADIYELSTMASLLKILSLKEVNRKGFSSGDLRYTIDGNMIYMDRIEFQGDAFSLIGKGEMTFDRKVRLVFYSVMGRGGVNIPILRDLLHATGSQIMMLTMEGPLQNPVITQHPLPGLDMALQQLEKELLPGSSRAIRSGSTAPGWKNRR